MNNITRMIFNQYIVNVNISKCVKGKYTSNQAVYDVISPVSYKGV